MMDEAYRLVFRGEVLDGQHTAVVKKRLVDALKLSDDQAQKMFSGSTVILKSQADTKTAARFQGLFKKAGARLRVMPVQRPDSGDEQTSLAEPATAESDPADAVVGIHLSPVGSDILGDDERAAVSAIVVSIPDFSVAEVGVAMVEPSEPVILDIDPDFDLAEIGAMIPSLPVDDAPVIDIASIRFDVAEVGADIGIPNTGPTALAPDISHLDLVAQ